MPFGPRLPHAELRSRAALQINSGNLPLIVPHEVVAGQGAGEPCAVCGQSIERSQTVYEVADSRYCHALALHVVCYSVWQLECSGRLQSAERQPPAEPASSVAAALCQLIEKLE